MLFLRNKSPHKKATMSQRRVIFVDVNFDATVDVVLNPHSPLFSHPLTTDLLVSHCTCEKSMLWALLLPWDLRQAASAFPFPWCQQAWGPATHTVTPPCISLSSPCCSYLFPKCCTVLWPPLIPNTISVFVLLWGTQSLFYSFGILLFP